MIKALLDLVPLRTWGFIALFALGGLTVGGIWTAGYNAASRKCDAAALRAENETLRRDIKIAQSAQVDADKRAAAIEIQAKKNQETVDALTAYRAKGAGTMSCRLDDDTARRLRAIR